MPSVLSAQGLGFESRDWALACPIRHPLALSGYRWFIAKGCVEPHCVWLGGLVKPHAVQLYDHPFGEYLKPVVLSGAGNWRQDLPEGSRPAPPHDATGHTWHHADAVLFAIVQQGPAWSTTPGSVYRMPAFHGTLSDAEIWDVLAYIKSTWPADIQAIQEEVNRQSQ